MSEIETGPRTKQPWEYQIGWARQNLLPSELGYFIKGLVGGLHVPLSSQTRPDRVDRDAKEFNRRAQKTQEAQNKFRFWTKAVADTKNNAENNFINMVRYREQERLKSMQTENNKIFNTLYSKFLLLEKNKFKLKANIIKHLSTGNQYLKEENEIQDESPAVLGPLGTDSLAAILAAGFAVAGAALKARGINTAFNNKHAQLTGAIRNIRKPGITGKSIKIGQEAERISSLPNDYGKYAKLLDNSKIIKHGALFGLGGANSAMGFIQDTKDYNEGHGNLQTTEMLARAASRFLTPYLAYSVARGTASSLGGIGARQAARRWSKKHQKLTANEPIHSKTPSKILASRQLTTPIESIRSSHPKYKGNQFGRIYDRNQLVGNDAFMKQQTVKQIWADKKSKGKYGILKKIFVQPVTTAYEVSHPVGKVLPSAADTGRGVGAATGIALGALALKDEGLSIVDAAKTAIEQVPGAVGEIATALPDFGVRGSVLNAVLNADSLRPTENEQGQLRGYRTVRTLSTPLAIPGTPTQEQLARREQMLTNTKGDGTPSYIPSNPNINSQYLVTKRDASILNRILRLTGLTEPERTITINTGKPTGKISSRSREITPKEEEDLRALLQSQRQGY